MRRESMWRTVALLMTVVALVFAAVAVVGASGAASPPNQETETRHSWTGVVGGSDVEGAPFTLKTDCGVWAFATEDSAIIEALESRLEQKVEVWGSVDHDSSTAARRVIAVEAVYGERDARPEMDVPDYPCVRHNAQPRVRREIMPPYPYGDLSQTLWSIMQRLGGASLSGAVADGPFDRFLGLELRIVDESGAEVVIAALPGTVVDFDADTLVLDPNGPEEDAQVFSMENVRVLRRGSATQSIQTGDKVVVVTKDGAPVVVTASRTVTVWPQTGPGPQLHRVPFGQAPLDRPMAMPFRGDLNHLPDELRQRLEGVWARAGGTGLRMSGGLSQRSMAVNTR